MYFRASQYQTQWTMTLSPASCSHGDNPLQLPDTLLPLGWPGRRHGDRMGQALTVDPRRESAYKICELLGSIVVTRGSCPVDFGRQGPDSVQFVQRPYPRTATTGRGGPMLLSFDAAPSRAGTTTRLALRLLGNSETAVWLAPFPQTRQRPHGAAKNAEAGLPGAVYRSARPGQAPAFVAGPTVRTGLTLTQRSFGWADRDQSPVATSQTTVRPWLSKTTVPPGCERPLQAGK